MSLNEAQEKLRAEIAANNPMENSPFCDKKLLLLKKELLRGTDLFSSLPESSIDTLAENCGDVVLQKGHVLFEEGALERRMYIVLSGEILIFKGRKNIAVLSPGEYVGEMALIDARPRSATARALGEVMLMEITEDMFRRVIASDPKALFSMMRSLSLRIRKDLEAMTHELQTVSNFTHDMRNCLVPLGMAEIFMTEIIDSLKGTLEQHRERKGSEKVRKCYDTMIAVRNNLVTLIDQSLACVKKEKKDYVKADLEVIPLVEETVEEISCHKKLRGKDIRVDVDGKIPKGRFNYLDIKRVLQNLLINAGYVSPKDGKIDVIVKDSSRGVEVSVRDYGAGIPDDIKPLLLKEAYTSKPDGNGFGLLSCREIIENFHEGKIWFETSQGEGTTFHFTVPHSG